MSGPQQPRQQAKAMYPAADTRHVARVWSVPPIAQYDVTTCWEACGRMLYFWRHQHVKNQQAVLAAYRKAAGKYLDDYFRKGLKDERDYYCKHLLMKEGKGKDAAVVEAYLRHSPLVIRITPKGGGGHAMVLTGYSDRYWYFINPQVYNGTAKAPQAATQHTFGEHTTHADKNGKEIHDENTVITPYGVSMNMKQSSWHAAVCHRPKDELVARLKPEFFSYDKPRHK